MADNRPIVFGPGDKLAQLEHVAMHPDTLPMDSQVSIVVCSRINKHDGKAVVGQAWIAKAIGCVERSVRASRARMHRLGLWHITPGGGRGLANIWTPTAVDKSAKPGNAVPGFQDETRQTTTRNPANNDTKPGSRLPPLPNTHLNSSYPPHGTAEHPGDSRWNSIKERLAQSLGRDGPALVVSWFDPIELVMITDNEILLRPPNRHHRHHIENNFLPGHLSDAVRAELGKHVRVRLVDPILRAAE